MLKYLMNSLQKNKVNLQTYKYGYFSKLDIVEKAVDENIKF